jgi:hypothetical protein
MQPTRVIKAKAQTEQSTEQGSTTADDGVCEPVNGTDVELGQGSESFQAYFIQAIKNNIGTGVLRLTDICGHQHSPTRNFVYRLACFGYKRALLEIYSSFLLVGLCLARASGNIYLLCYLLY